MWWNLCIRREVLRGGGLTRPIIFTPDPGVQANSQTLERRSPQPVVGCGLLQLFTV